MTKTILFVLLLGCVYHYGLCNAIVKNIFAQVDLPEARMNVSAMIKYHGYPCQIHTVITKDGFILTMQRIPYGLKSKPNGQPVFLQHGLVDSAATWTMNSPTQSLAFILADAGYDVWLGNSRGNTYSRKHVKYTPNDDQFWDFSFDEMAKFDLPACINYIVNTTGRNIHYIGHSQGTTIGFIEFGRNFELAKKVKTFFALAPVATVGHVKGAIQVLSRIEAEVQFFIKLLGIHEFLPSNELTKFLAIELCGASHILEETCGNIIFLLAGFDTSNLNKTRLPVYLSHLPAGTSVKDIIHFAQMVKNNKFQMYDYGINGNKKHYNQPTVPQYNVSNVRLPVALFSGSNDWLADPNDVKNGLGDLLPNIVYKKNMKDWNHLDFVWGITAHQVIYNDIIRLMDKSLAYQ